MEDQEVERSDILLLPFFGQGHLFPFIELSKHLSTSLDFTTTLLIPSPLSSSIPSAVRCHHSRLRVVEITTSASPHDPPPEPGPLIGPQVELLNGLESFISGLPARPDCVVIDVMMGWAKDVFVKFGISIVVLFTSGACSAAMEYGSWKAHVSDLKPGQARVIPGLPEEMAVSYSDIVRQSHHPHHPPGPMFGPRGPSPTSPHDVGFHNGPSGPGQRPGWVTEVKGTVGIMMNTCHEIEGPFLEYMANQIGKPVWGVGPLLPEQYWSSNGALVHDHDIRVNKQSNYTEEDVSQWLDPKPHASVIYISFGTEVGPTLEEYAELANALEETTHPFIWVIQSGRQRPDPPPPHLEGQPSPNPPGDYNPLGLESTVGERGLIIRGWAPQLTILSHPSIGGFVSHCGWNSTVEAIGRGIPLLAWPIRGDQHHNAKLVTSYLKVGCMVTGDGYSCIERVKKDDIVDGIQKLTSDASIKEHVSEIQANLKSGVPRSSTSAFDAFRKHVLAIKDGH